MIQVEVFDEENEVDLSDIVNDFLVRLSDSSLIDIRYSCSHFVTQSGEQIYSYSAMVIYKSMLK